MDDGTNMDTNREEILISKVVDRCESAAEWEELEGIAGRDTAVWQRLRATLRDDALLRQAVVPELAVADNVEAPPAALGLRGMLAPLGWLAAALFAALWLYGPSRAPEARPARVDANSTDSNDAVGGKHSLGELPPLLVRSQPTEDGKALRVVTMRRILQESIIDKVYQVGEDEFGDVQPMQVELSLYANPSDF
jgi:hypothetical protein